MAELRRVVFANECDPCLGCDEPVCPFCDDHYSECPCLGTVQVDELGADIIETDAGHFIRVESPEIIA